MKKILFFFIFTALLLCGCSQGSEIQTRVDLASLGPGNHYELSAMDETSDSTASDFDFYGQDVIPEYRISAVTTEEQQTYSTQDGTGVLFVQQLQSTTLRVPERPRVEDEINRVLESIRSDILREARETQEIAVSDHSAAVASGDVYYGYSYYTTDTITRLDTAVFSMTTYFSNYTGGAHPNNSQRAYNFDVYTGFALSLADVLLPEGEAGLESMVLDWLREKADDFGLFKQDIYGAVVADRFGQENLKDQYEAWYFSENGLVLFFNPYDITSYSAGVVKVEFPYSTLVQLLEPKYFPASVRSGSSGSFTVSLLEEAPAESGGFTDYVTAGGGDYILAIQGVAPVYDLTLTQVSWIGQQAITQETLYAANLLAEGDQILVTVVSQDALKDLCLQCNPGNGTDAVIYLGEVSIDQTATYNFD